MPELRTESYGYRLFCTIISRIDRQDEVLLMTSTNALDFLSDPCYASVRIPSSNQGNSGKGTKQLYADWQSLSYGNGEAFRGKMIASDGLAEMRLIHLPALNTTKKQALANQIALIQSVGSSLSKKIIEYSLDETSSRIVLSYTESHELKEFLACTTPFSRLELGANLLAKINGSLKVGLYHGCISSSSVRVVTESSSRCSLDYLERFYSQTMIEDYGPGILYDKDVSDSVKLINEILYPLTEEKTAVDLLSSRQLAILKRLCRDSVDGTPAESVFEHWLDFFRDWTEAAQDGGAPLRLTKLSPLI